MDALKSYNEDKASLYFGASVEFRDLYMKALNFQMGHNFAGYYPMTAHGKQGPPTLDQMAEIETFVSRAGNYTDWHTDF